MDPTVQSFSYKITSKKYKFELRKCNFLVHFNFTPTDLLIGGGINGDEVSGRTEKIIGGS